MPRTPPVLRAAARRASLATLVLGTACLPGMRGSFREGSPLAAVTRSAAGVTRLELDAAVGDVELTTQATDSVRVEVTLRSQDGRRLEQECIPNASLVAEAQTGVLVVRLDQRTRNRCGTRWRIAIPESLGVRVRAHVGDITATGLGGAIDVETGNGDIVVHSRAARHGSVAVRSDVGRVALQIHGYDAPAATRRGAGQLATARGPGGPDISLRTRVGNASLVLGSDQP